MPSKYFGGADSERGVQKDWRRGDFAALHQIDDVDDQLLSAFDREGGDEQRAFGGRGVTKHDGKMLAPCLRGRGRTIDVAVGRLGNHIIESRRCLRVGLEQLGIGTDVAGNQDSQ